MAMEARLSLRQSQRVVMTPLLQQAIQLLQLSTLELQEVVQKELLENPLLEEEPQDGEAPAGPNEPEAATAPPPEPVPENSRNDQQIDDLPFDLAARLFDDHEERSLVAQEEREELRFENIARSASSLADHLDEQLRFATEEAQVRRIGEEIIGNLDEDGYLRAELGEIAGRCEATPDEVERVLTEVVQKFDPIGVGART